jgi:hypothetical protein
MGTSREDQKFPIQCSAVLYCADEERWEERMIAAQRSDVFNLTSVGKLPNDEVLCEYKSYDVLRFTFYR